MYALRSYQRQAVEAMVSAITSKLDAGSIVVSPTGSGKSVLIAETTNRLNVPTLIICPSKEILKQNRDELYEYVDKKNVGIFSASMNEKTIKTFTFCTIGSIYKKPELFSHFGLIIIDECDLMPLDEGMFVTFIKKIRQLTGQLPQVIGLTATPYRLVNETRYYGRIMHLESKIQMLTKTAPWFWKRIIFNIDNWELVKQGHITPLKVIEEVPLMPYEFIKESSGDFALKSYDWNTSRKEYQIIDVVNKARKEYKSVLVFCCTVEQAERLSEKVYDSAVVTAKTKPKDRDEIIEDFKSGVINVVFNVGVLTCGFNHPGLDCIVLARPTKSVRLYYQIVGRAIRICSGKLYGTLIDLTGTTKAIGRIESIKIREDENGWGLYTKVGRMDNKVLYSYEKEF